MEVQVTHVSIKVGSGYNLLTKNEWLEDQDQPDDIPGMGERFFGRLVRRSG